MAHILILDSPSKITGLILQTLLTIVSQIEGSLEILRLEDPSPLIEIASQYSYVLDIFKFTWINASTGVSRMDMVRENIDQVLPALIVSFQSTDAVTLLTFVGDLLPKLDSQVRSDSLASIQRSNKCSACPKIRDGSSLSFCSFAILSLKDQLRVEEQHILNSRLHYFKWIHLSLLNCFL
jgi:hypothetical protein